MGRAMQQAAGVGGTALVVFLVLVAAAKILIGRRCRYGPSGQQPRSGR
jgi:hypothetical protein